MMVKERERDVRDDRPSADEYARMDEGEKDQAIREAVIRLQNRIQKILNLFREELIHEQHTRGKEVKRNAKDH